MTTPPQFAAHDLDVLPASLAELLPRQGSIELQCDGPGKTHDWHYHSVDEELLILSGDVMLSWRDGDEVGRRRCISGARIALPANTPHRSTAGAEGAVYVIRPLQGGAETVWLTSEERPVAALAR